MNYEQSNVGPGMVPCKKGCRCTECQIVAKDQRIKDLQAVVDAIKHYCYSGGTQVITVQRIIEQDMAALEGEQHASD